MDHLSSAFEAACARFDGHNFDDLDEVDRVLVTIWGLEADVNNGGFDQFYFNGSGDLAFFAPSALRLIGANRMGDLVTQANAVFGPDGPTRSRTARQAQLFLVAPPDGDRDPWDELDRAFQAYPDDIADLLTGFLRMRGRLT
jgi:Domain of unknown function (DUF4375)